MFESIAFVKYNEAVRGRVNEKGIGQFGIIETDKVYSHFSLENTVKVTEKNSTIAKRGPGTTRSSDVNKSETHCIRFNNYNVGGKGRCSYLHACYVCESKDHSKRDCPKKANKKEIVSKSEQGIAISEFKVDLSDNGDVTASSRPAPSHGTIDGVHSHNETNEVYNPKGESVPIYSPQVSINNVNPPLVGFGPLKRPKVTVKYTCPPPVRLPADSETGTINGDVTTTCVCQNVGAIDDSQESKVDYHDLNCVNEFSGHVNHTEAIDNIKTSRNDFSDLKLDS